MTPARPPEDDAPLARLLAGGRHNRLAMVGALPSGLAIGETAHFAQVVRLLWDGQPGDGFAGHPVAVADPLRLPFVEAVLDRLIVTNVLPADSARAALRELWRVMSPAALAVLVVKARRPWQWTAPGWLDDDLRTALDEAMFEVLAMAVETVPDRHHLVLVGKRDGLRAAPIGAVQTSEAPVTA